MRRLKLGVMALGIAAVSFLAIAAFACGDGQKADHEDVATTLMVGLQEWGVVAHESEVRAGDVAFVVVNHGAILHELVILKTDVPADKLEVSANGKVEEDNYGEVGEIEDVAPGESKSATFNLEPGKYVFICNIAGHYPAGMHATLIVK